MSEVMQEAEASSADTQPVPNEAETQDQEIETQEQEAKETDDKSPEAESEPEKTIEERMSELEQDTASKQKAIDRKTAAYSSLQKAHEKTLQELQELRTKQVEQEPLKEPVIDDFETHDDYLKARDEFVINRTKQEAIEEFQQQSLQQQEQRIAHERNQLVNKQEAEYIQAAPEYPHAKAEFDAFIKTAQVNPAVEKAIVEQSFKGNIPQLIDYFGRNSGENIGKLEEISQMSPVEAAVEIYKVQQSLKPPENKKVKPASAPVNRPKGGGAPRKDVAKGDVLVNLGLKKQG